MTSLFTVLWPELLLMTVACVLFVLGVVPGAGARRAAPVLALAALLVVFGVSLCQITAIGDISWTTILSNSFSSYIKLLASGVAVLFVLLSWPTNSDGGGNAAIDFGGDTAEFFGLLLLSISGVFLVAGANDIMLLFLGIELASIPTYIMVSVSRPLPVAQEAGVKYFFLGAMSAAVMLFGFSYLYGTTGETSLDGISSALHTASAGGTLTSWQLLAVVMLLAGFAFKIAAVPLHAYAGDVYQGAATPVTALLAFVPKTSGMVAIIKMLAVVGGAHWVLPHELLTLLWVMAVLTMTFGNVLGLLQFNIKRVLAYSSVAHSGYMLVGLTALVAAHSSDHPHRIQTMAIAGVLFYLAAYGVMNAGAFGVLMMLPARPLFTHSSRPGTTTAPTGGVAETFEDIAGQGRRHIGLALCMAVCCFSLTGLPLTIGFFGKLYLIQPALAITGPERSMMVWLVALTMVNAAISAAYYLKIVATLFLRPEPNAVSPEVTSPAIFSLPASIAVGLSVVGTLAFGVFFPATNSLSRRVQAAAEVQPESTASVAPTVAMQR